MGEDEYKYEYELRKEVRRRIKYDDTPVGKVVHIAPLDVTSVVTDYIPEIKKRKRRRSE